ncbi:MAG: HD domain-containing protein [Lachnospiraceae bacterium]|nr:HD domain-containing protein [Lachnospiraceae bacterium]
MSDSLELKKEIDAFVQRTLTIRKLSSPDILMAENANDYGAMLKKNFLSIGDIAADNRAMLDRYIMPILESDELLDDDVMEDLNSFLHFLLNPWPEEELDLTLLFLLSRRLLDDAVKKDNPDLIIRHCGAHINACYNNMDRVNRLRVSRELPEFYLQEGLRAADILLKYLDHDRFLTLSPESRDAVLSHSRFYVALYDTFYTTDEKTNDLRISELIRSIDFAEDPSYVDNTPGRDWKKHVMRCMEHMSQLTENGNQWKLTPIQCSVVAEYSERLRELWDEDPETGERNLPRVHLDLILLRNTYYSGRMDLSEYRERLLMLYERYSNEKYDMYSVLANIFIPTEYMATVSNETINENIYDTLRWLYRRITEYILHSKNSESFSFLLEYLTSFLERFIEIPGEITFESMCLNCLAALHPPTYVHSLQVAAISRCLCEHLISQKPEAFIGILGCEDEDEVRERRDDILFLIYHAALCHDFGKICMTDTIFIYWRRILDEDFEIIREHPANGVAQMDRYSSSRRYHEIVLGHHRWYDGSDGYPDDFDITTSPDRILISILTVADCVDAATDSIGRSFKETTVSVEELMREFKEGSGTRYCPDVIELFDLKAVQDDIDFLLHQGREDNYKNAYYLLKNMG